MRFFSDKKIISTIFSITLFNGVLAQGVYNPMVNYRNAVPGTGPSQNGNSNQLHRVLIANDSEPESPSTDDIVNQDLSGNFGIHQGINGQGNADGPLNGDSNRAPQFDAAGSSTIPTPANRANRPKATTTTSNKLTTTTTSTTINTQSTSNPTTAPTTTTTVAPTPTPAPTANSSPAPAPSSGNSIADSIFGVIKSIFGFFWSHRVGIWNFLYSNILAPIWDWINKKWFS